MTNAATLSRVPQYLYPNPTNGNILIGSIGAAPSPLGGSSTVVVRGIGTNPGGVQYHNSVSGGGLISGITGSTGGMAFSVYSGAIGSEVYTEEMRITSNGNLLLNTTATPVSGGATIVVGNFGTNPGGVELVAASNNGGGLILPAAAGGIQFYTFTGAAGSETYSAALLSLTKPGTNATGNLAMSGNITATLEITAYFSDMRLKDNVRPITNAMDKVSAINGVYYNPNQVAEDLLNESRTSTKVGLIAQEVEAVMPQVIRAAPFDINPDGTSKSGEHYKTVQYEKLVPLLVEAIKELDARVAKLEANQKSN